MYPVNQVILGNNTDPLFSPAQDLDAQIQMMDAYRNRLQQLKSVQATKHLIWDDIDAEINPLSNAQKERLFNNLAYAENYQKLQQIVQNELLNLVKEKIEKTPEGKELLERQLKLAKELKVKIVEDTNREMELFKRFKEYSNLHPEVTYDEFLKTL